MAFTNLGLGTPAAALVRAIYPNMQGRYRDRAYLSERAILAPRNDDVDLLNGVASDAFPGAFVELLSQDFIDDEETQGAALYPTEFLNSLNLPSLPPHRLMLKEGQPIVLLRNLDPKSGLCNGTRLICTRIGRRVIEAEIMTRGAADQPPSFQGSPSSLLTTVVLPLSSQDASSLFALHLPLPSIRLRVRLSRLWEYTFLTTFSPMASFTLLCPDALIQTISASQFIHELYPA